MFFAKTKCLSLMLLDVKLFSVYTDNVVHSPGLDKAFDAFWVHKYCCNNNSQCKLSREDAINLPEKTYNRKKKIMVKNKLSHYCSELQKSTQFFCCLPKTGLSLRAGVWDFCPATMRMNPRYFHRNQKEYRAKVLPSCTISLLLIADTKQLEMLVTALPRV